MDFPECFFLDFLNSNLNNVSKVKKYTMHKTGLCTSTEVYVHSSQLTFSPSNMIFRTTVLAAIDKYYIYIGAKSATEKYSIPSRPLVTGTTNAFRSSLNAEHWCNILHRTMYLYYMMHIFLSLPR